MSAIPDEIMDKAEDQAAYWVARIEAGDMTPAETRAWQAWLDEDEAHRGLMLRTHALWMSLEAAPAAETAPQETHQPALWRRRSFLAASAAASVAGVLGARRWLDQAQSFSTDRGEVRRVPLVDGSAMTLNSETGVRVRMERSNRLVSLAHGEAWFEVAKDAKRPFVVNAGKFNARAVGTAFAFRQHGDAVEVLVTEGVVETWSDGDAGSRMRLTRGQRVVASQQAITYYKNPDEARLERALAWRSGEINLLGNTLAEAAEEFNRYNNRQLVVSDGELAGEPIAGVFRMNDPEGFAVAVKASLGVDIDLRDPQSIRIGPRLSQ